MSDAVQELIGKIVDGLFQMSPVEASFQGYGKYDHKLDDMSPEAHAHYLELVRGWKGEVQDALEMDLGRDDRIDLELVNAALEQGVFEVETIRGHKRNPGQYVDIVASACYLAITAEHLPVSKRLGDLASRLDQVPRLLEQAKQCLTSPLKPSTEAALEMIPGAAAFVGCVGEGMDADEVTMKRLSEARTSAADALTSFQKWLKEDALLRATDQVGLGRDAYAWLLSNRHFLDWTPEQMLAFGEKQIKDIKKKMSEYAVQIVGSDDWQHALQVTGENHPQVDDLVAAYQRDVDNLIDFLTDRQLVTLPGDDELIIEPTPEFMKVMIPYAAYLPPGPYLKQEAPGRFWVSTVDENLPPEQQKRLLTAHNDYTRPITSLHEAYPGHHLQLVYSNRYGSPARWMGHYPTFIEGWAFYCEDMMLEQGFIQGPEYHLWQLRDELWRAVRIVIDASYHCRGMKLEQAQQLLMDVVKFEPEHALAEARWYINRPSYPMSYMVGKHELKKVYHECVQVRKQDLGQFHDQLLQTAGLPIKVAAEVMLG